MRKPANNNLILAILSFALVVCLIVGGTLAYLTDITEKRANNFTFAATGIEAHIVEPHWDGVVDYEYDDEGDLTPLYGYDGSGNPIYGYTGNDPDEPITDIEEIDGKTGEQLRPLTNGKRPDPTTPAPYGDKASQLMIPGSVALKNPVIFNAGSMLDIWVAAKITFVYAKGHASEGKPLEEEDFEKILAAIDIDWEYDPLGGSKWTQTEITDDGISRVYYYTDRPLLKVPESAAAGVYDTTDPMFTKVSVKEEATNEQIQALIDMGGFVIYIEGFAAQSEVAEDGDEFLAWGAADDNVHFDNSPADDNAVNVDKPGIIPKP